MSVDVNNVAEKETPIDKALLYFVRCLGGWGNDVANSHSTNLGVAVFESEGTSGRGGGGANILGVFADEENGLVVKAQLGVNAPEEDTEELVKGVSSGQRAPGGVRQGVRARAGGLGSGGGAE